MRIGEAEILVDARLEQVRVTHRPEPLLGLPRGIARPGLFVLAAAAAAALYWVEPFLGLYGLGFVLWRASGRDPVTFPPIVISARSGTVRVRRTVLDLDRATVELDDVQGWRLGDGERSVALGSSWGGHGAAWLQRTIDAAREGQLATIEGRLQRPQHVPYPRVPLGEDVEVRMDPSGIIGEKRISSSRWVEWSWPIVFSSLGVVGVGLAAHWPFWVTGAVIVVVAMVLVAVQEQARPPSVHQRIRIDRQAVHIDDGTGPRRIPLSEITAVHLALAVLEVHLRDGRATGLGYGWSASSLRELEDHLKRALEGRSSPDDDEAQAVRPPVPAALRRLRGERE